MIELLEVHSAIEQAASELELVFFFAFHTQLHFKNQELHLDHLLGWLIPMTMKTLFEDSHRQFTHFDDFSQYMVYAKIIPDDPIKVEFVSLHIYHNNL